MIAPHWCACAVEKRIRSQDQVEKQRNRCEINGSDQQPWVLMAGMRVLRPLGTGNLNSPDWATHIQCLVYSDERRRALTDDPNLRIAGLLAYQWRNHSGNTTDLNLYGKRSCFVTSAGD